MLGVKTLYRQYIQDLQDNKLNVNQYSGSTDWTVTVKTWWAQQGIKYPQLLVCANKVALQAENFCNTEYMCDVVWLESKPRTNLIELALECEWHKDQEYDFRKLVYVKANRKVFIFQLNKSDNVDQRVRKFQMCINSCRIAQDPQEQYLLIGHVDKVNLKGESRRDRLHAYVSDEDNTLKPIHPYPDEVTIR